MGLDISVYATAELLPEHEMVEDCWEHGHVKAFCYDGMERSLRGLEKDREYQTEGWSGAFNFRAGSYGGYNAFRAALSMAALNLDPQDVWQNGEKYQDAPFYELVSFADNEGTIGPDASADLYEDFVTHRDQIFATWNDGFDANTAEYYQASYDNWLKAFEIAKDGGIVDFH